MDNSRLDFNLQLNQTVRSRRLLLEVELIGVTQQQLIDNNVSFYLVCQYGQKAQYKYDSRLNLIHLLDSTDLAQQSNSTNSSKTQSRLNDIRHATINRSIFEDLSGFYNKQSKLFLIINNLREFGVGDNQDYVVSLIQVNLNNDGQFMKTAINIQLKQQDSKSQLGLCPFDCSQNGKCISDGSDPYCVCDKHYIGEDCSTYATQIQYGQENFQIEVTETPKFYYFDFMPYDYTKFKIEKKQDSQSILTIQARVLNNFDRKLQLPYSSSGSIRFHMQQSKDTFVIYTKEYNENIALMNLKANEHKMTIMMFQLQKRHQSQHGIEQSVRMDIELEMQWKCPVTKKMKNCSQNQINLEPIFIIIYTLVFILLIVCCIKVKGHGTVNTVFINNYFPKQKYNYKQSDEEQCCPICLQEYKQDDLVRVTLCRHMIHQECLDHWLRQKLDCPYCRSSFTQNVLQKWFNSQQNRNKYEQLVTEMTNQLKTKSNQMKVETKNLNAVNDNMIQTPISIQVIGRTCEQLQIQPNQVNVGTLNMEVQQINQSIKSQDRINVEQIQSQPNDMCLDNP